MRRVMVRITNAYACGRVSTKDVLVPEPPAARGPVQPWWDEFVHELTGDGHPCGSREHAVYTATIFGPSHRDDVIGASTVWEG